MNEVTRILSAIEAGDEQAAEKLLLGGSAATLKREWSLARAWLYRRLGKDRHQPSS